MPDWGSPDLAGIIVTTWCGQNGCSQVAPCESCAGMLAAATLAAARAIGARHGAVESDPYGDDVPGGLFPVLGITGPTDDGNRGFRDAVVAAYSAGWMEPRKSCSCGEGWADEPGHDHDVAAAVEYPRTVDDHRGTVWACCESRFGRPCAHERHLVGPPPGDMTVQFCRGDQDISGDFYAADDATEVRAWLPDGICMGAVTLAEESGGWRVSGSDAADWTIYADTAFGDWRQPLAVVLAAAGFLMPAEW